VEGVSAEVLEVVVSVEENTLTRTTSKNRAFRVLKEQVESTYLGSSQEGRTECQIQEAAEESEEQEGSVRSPSMEQQVQELEEATGRIIMQAALGVVMQFQAWDLISTVQALEEALGP
jgi:hypothetical protein